MSPASGGAQSADDLLRRTRIGEIDRAVAFFDRKARKRLPQARTVDAFAGRKHEARAMTRAEEVFLVLGQEMVREGLERNVLVRAGIYISVARALRLHD